MYYLQNARHKSNHNSSLSYNKLIFFPFATFAQTNKNAYFCSAISNKGLVVQLNRTQDSGSWSRGFESRRGHKRGMLGRSSFFCLRAFSLCNKQHLIGASCLWTNKQQSKWMIRQERLNQKKTVTANKQHLWRNYYYRSPYRHSHFPLPAAMEKRFIFAPDLRLRHITANRIAAD